MYKILTGKENVEYTLLFTMDLLITTPENTACDCMSPEILSDLDRTSSVKEQLTNDWNGLPQSVVDASSVKSFKNLLDELWKDMGV